MMNGSKQDCPAGDDPAPDGMPIGQGGFPRRPARSSVKTTRRRFLQTAGGASVLLAFGPRLPEFLCRSVQAAASQPRSGRDTVLVVIQLSGGNDGLNTVVPFNDDHYHRLRPTLRLPANRLHRIGPSLGFHPEMASFHRLYDQGLLSILQGVGYPNSSRDHDQALRDWHTARPKEPGCQTGWVGRTIDQVYQTNQLDLPGMFVGDIQIPFGLQTERVVVPVIDSLRQWISPTALISDPSNAYQQYLTRMAKAAPAGPEQALLPFLQQAMLAACTSGQRLHAMARAQTRAGPAQYPQFRLAQTLQTIAQFIRAELGIRIYFAELGGGGIGGFDTHANQAANHGALLRQLSDSVSAFVHDLNRDNLLDRVLLVTFSEFGRTVGENGRRGTDHGVAAPVFLAGTALKGPLLGEHPSLTDLDGDALRFHTDFRRVYATILDRWLGFDSQPILGESFEPLPLFA